MEGDDPWNWDIDRVVQELTTDRRTWRAKSATQSLPDAASLASLLRELEVDGSTLLTEINGITLKDEFNLKSLRHRGTIMHAIGELRERSQLYENWAQIHRVDRLPSQRSYSASSFHPNIGEVVRSISPTGVGGTAHNPSALVLNGANEVSAIRNQTIGLQYEQLAPIPQTDPESDQERASVTDAAGHKRRRLSLTANGDLALYETMENGPMGFPVSSDKPPVGPENGAITQSTTVVSQAPVRKRKRIAPTLVSSSIDPNIRRNIPSEADNVIFNDPQNIEPGVVYTGEDGKKRLVLIPAAGSTPEWRDILSQRHQGSSIPSSNDLNNGSQDGFAAAKHILALADRTKRPDAVESMASGYLGKKSQPIDQVFYDGTIVGQEIFPSLSPQEFSQSRSAQISEGRRIYVHRVMKHFLFAEPQVILRNNKYFSAKIPYSSRLAAKHHYPSFSLFHASNDGTVRVTKEALSHWPELDTDVPGKKASHLQSDDEHRAEFMLPMNMTLDGPNSYSNWDPSLLDKYRHLEGGDEILPLYGESDEENDYDIETWREYEEEFGEQEKPLIPSNKRGISKDEINTAIDEGIAQLVKKWHDDKWPKRKGNAWRLWAKSRRDHSKGRLIREAQHHLNRINLERLAKMRKEILDEVWYKQNAVRKQTRIMEQSIFDREDLIWQISVLESKKAPEKPAPVDKASSSLKQAAVECVDANITDDEESLNTESEAENSQDSLDDFIISDQTDVASSEHHDRIAADAEDEDAAISDANASSYDADGHRYKRRDKNTAINSAVSSPAVQDQPMNNALEFLPPKPDPNSPICQFQIPIQEGTSSPGPKQSQVKDSCQRLALLKEVPTGLIDLTFTSDDDKAAKLNSRGKLVDLATAGKPKPQKESQAFPGFEANGFALQHRRLKRVSMPNENSTIIDISDSEDVGETPKVLPPLKNPIAVAKYPASLWQKTGDRSRLLVTLIQQLTQDSKDKIFSLITSQTYDDLWKGLNQVLIALRDHEDKVRGLDAHTFTTFTGIIQLFEMYIECRKLSHQGRPAPAIVEKLEKAENMFPAFLRLLRKTLKRLGQAVSTTVPTSMASEDDDEEASLSRRTNPLILSDDEETNNKMTPHKTRKNKIFENAQARNLREQNQQRLREQEERRQVLRLKLARSDAAAIDVDPARIIVNDGKHEHQGFVYVNKQISQRIKSHQVNGVRFMWSQIVANEGIMQGCLLAHTMGLGKTMQVITLLVAIAEASASPDVTVSCQIPNSLKVSRSLILCPPGLIDNWMDELLTWVPEDVNLGELLKVDSSMKGWRVRLGIIQSWYTDGGILVMGYEMFRNLILNKASSNRDAPLDEEEHNQVLKHLLEGPHIVVADEAHKMKNASASITGAANRIETTSRIALTGSPLANNVEEYHTMIDWVAPNYLGPIDEFRAKYVEPIQDGLWLDSTSYERRKSLKMLGVLKEDLSPKVHRADMSVLRNDLPPKTEFVVTVPLTDLQHKAYTLYVKSMLDKSSGQLTKAGELQQTTLWHWLAILSLLCNHPECFRAKLKERKDDVEKEMGSRRTLGSTLPTDSDPIADDLNAPVWKVGVSEELIRQEMELFEKFGDIEAIENSNKVKVLVQILDAARAVEDKVLIFSQSIPTLDYLETLCQRTNRSYARLDGSTIMKKRQGLTKEFNTGRTELYLISTTAGGLGLNLPGANRVIIFDFKFNPIMEEQAVGRAYRIGQKKPVYVYRFVAGGTFEAQMHNKTVFKKQLASRVVDKKTPMAWAKRKTGEFLFEPKEVKQSDLTSFRGMDPHVLDKVLDSQEQAATIRDIVVSDTFERNDDEKLTAEEENEVRQLITEEKLKRRNPKAFHDLQAKRAREEYSKTLRREGFGEVFVGTPPSNMTPNLGTSQLSGQNSSTALLSPSAVNGIESARKLAISAMSSDRVTRESMQAKEASHSIRSQSPHNNVPDEARRRIDLEESFVHSSGPSVYMLDPVHTRHILQAMEYAVASYVFPPGQVASILLPACANAIQHAIAKISHNDQALIATHCDTIAKYLQFDLQLCINLFSGKLDASGVVVRVLGEAPGNSKMSSSKSGSPKQAPISELKAQSRPQSLSGSPMIPQVSKLTEKKGVKTRSLPGSMSFEFIKPCLITDSVRKGFSEACQHVLAKAFMSANNNRSKLMASNEIPSDAAVQITKTLTQLFFATADDAESFKSATAETMRDLASDTQLCVQLAQPGFNLDTFVKKMFAKTRSLNAIHGLDNSLETGKKPTVPQTHLPKPPTKPLTSSHPKPPRQPRLPRWAISDIEEAQTRGKERRTSQYDPSH